MQGNNAENNMAKNKQLAEQLAELTQNAIADGAIVETIPPVETEQEQDSTVSLSGRTVPVKDVVSHVTKSNGVNANILRLDLVALQGHRVADVTNIKGQGDVMVSASFGRLKTQPKGDNQELRDKRRMMLLAEAEQAFNKGEFAKAKECYAEVNAMSEGTINVVRDSGKSFFDIDLDSGRIVGDKYQYSKSTKDDPLIWVDGIAHRLRYTIQRGLFKSEQPKQTKRQKERAQTRAEREAANSALLAAIKLQGQREYQLQLAEQKNS